MIEVDKKYKIAIDADSELASALNQQDIKSHGLLGTVTHIHQFGFLFKLDALPKKGAADVNILWNILKWIMKVEDIDEMSRCGQNWYVNLFANFYTKLTKYHCFLCGYPNVVDGEVVELK